MNTETTKNQPNKSQSQDTEVQWMWCWRCGGGSVCQRRLCRRTESQQDSPHTLLLCERQRTRRRWMFFSYCAKHSNHHQSRTDSRTDCFLQTNSQHCLLSFWFLCNSLIYKLFLSTRPPSNSDQSEHFYTAAETSSQICLDDQDMTDPPPHMSPSCCCQTVVGLCLLCLGPVPVHRHLMERTRHKQLQFIICWFLNNFTDNYWK